MKTLPDQFREAAQNYSDRPAIVTPEQTVSYAELDAQLNVIAPGLLAKGVQPGVRFL